MPTATSNPTMDLIRSLDDPRKWAVKRGVAVFRPHTRKFPDGTVVEVSDDDLAEIAANINRHYQRNGELVRLTEGHRRQPPDYPEVNQPATLGFARNYRAEVVERPGGKFLALTHDEYLPRGREDLWAQYPGRSAEYDPSTSLITGVAFLKRDPALPLGTVHYQGSKNLYPLTQTECHRALHYQRETGSTWGEAMTAVRTDRTDSSSTAAPLTQTECRRSLHYMATQKVDWTSAMAHVKGQRRK